MNLKESLDGLVSSYYYRRYFGLKGYILFFLKNLRPINKESFLKRIEEYTKIYSHRYTIFLTGIFIKNFPSFVHKLYKLGHEIGYHSYYHISPLSKKPRDFKKDIIAGKQLFASLNIPLKGYRAPHLLFNDAYYSILQEMGLVFSSSKYLSKSFYKVTDNFIEAPVNFMDIFDYEEDESFDILIRKFKSNKIHLLHPYCLFSKKNEKRLNSLFSGLNEPVIAISDLLEGRKGVCITVDIGI